MWGDGLEYVRVVSASGRGGCLDDIRVAALGPLVAFKSCLLLRTQLL